MSFGKHVPIYEEPLYQVEGFEGNKLQKAQSVVQQTPGSFSNKKPR